MPKTPIVEIDPEHPDPRVIARAARIIRQGGLVAFGTETVYGLGADATNPDAVARIFEAKGRPPTNPLIVHVADRADAPACVSGWDDRAERLAEHFWPGPLSLVLPRSEMIPDIVTAGQETVGVRVPLTPVARWLIFESGRPIAAPSANRSNGTSPTQARHVAKDLDGKVDLILDSGPTTVGIESTVLDLTTRPIRVLRPGLISPLEIAEFLSEIVLGPNDILGRPSESLKSPGQLMVHYAPRTPTYRVHRDRLPEGKLSGHFLTIILGEISPGLPLPDVRSYDLTLYQLADPVTAARELYSWLHRLDARGLEFLLIVMPPDESGWAAIRDRVTRATKPWPPTT